jgi:hypothetical protein
VKDKDVQILLQLQLEVNIEEDHHQETLAMPQSNQRDLDFLSLFSFAWRMPHCSLSQDSETTERGTIAIAFPAGI